MMNEATDELVLWAPSGENITEEELTSGRPTQLTPDLKSLVQEVIDLEGWRAGNAIAFLIDGMPQYDGTGALRTYESYEGANSDGHAWTTNEPEFGPTLEVTFDSPKELDKSTQSHQPQNSQCPVYMEDVMVFVWIYALRDHIDNNCEETCDH